MADPNGTPVNIDPEGVIQRLANQVGQMAAELAMRDTALEAVRVRIAELTAELEEKDRLHAELARAHQVTDELRQRIQTLEAAVPPDAEEAT